jgi:hypothetical protein
MSARLKRVRITTRTTATDLVGEATQPSARRFVRGFFATLLLGVAGFLT